MFIHHVLIDRFFLSKHKNIIPPIVVGSMMLYATYGDNPEHRINKNIKDDRDLIMKPHKPCDKELTAFAKCYEEHRHNREVCDELLEAYRKCVQEN